MDKVLLKTIAWQQTNRFFYSYGVDWRMQQILSLEKQLQNKFEFFRDIVEESKKGEENINVDAVIAQEISNGLFLDAISVANQAIEDVFSMLMAGQRPLKFIGGAISYSAGKVDNFIKQKHKEKDIATLFYFPLFDESYETDEQQGYFTEGLQRLCNYIGEMKKFYTTYRFFYMQYKHGLSVALRAYIDYNEEQIADRKAEPFRAYPIAFDNYSLTKLDANDVRAKQKILMPYLTPEIMPHIQQLIREDNLLRFVTPDEPLEFKDIKTIVETARICQRIFANNLLNSLADKYPMALQLPGDERGISYVFSFPKDVHQKAGNKQIFT